VSGGVRAGRPDQTVRVTLNVLVNGGPPCSRRNWMVTVAGVWPTRPSASPHFVPVLVMPKLLCASYHYGAGSGQYCDRYATIGTLACTCVATATLASAGSAGQPFRQSQARHSQRDREK
jgi:hypothetical protein